MISGSRATRTFIHDHDGTQNTTPDSGGIYFQTFVENIEEVLQFKVFKPW